MILSFVRVYLYRARERSRVCSVSILTRNAKAVKMTSRITVELTSVYSFTWSRRNMSRPQCRQIPTSAVRPFALDVLLSEYVRVRCELRGRRRVSALCSCSFMQRATQVLRSAVLVLCDVWSALCVLLSTCCGLRSCWRVLYAICCIVCRVTSTSRTK